MKKLFLFLILTSTASMARGAVIMYDFQNRAYLVQNDLRDWYIDASSNPVECLNADYWIERGISVDPVDIPSEPIAPTVFESVEDILRRIMPLRKQQ